MSGTPAPAYLYFGVGAGKKYFKKAVDRNRIKRLTREAYRLQKETLQAALQQKADKELRVFFIFIGKEMPQYQTLSTKVEAVLRRLEEQLNKGF